MPRHASYVPHGVIPAVLLPFENDLSIDEPSFRRHLRDVAAVEGLSAITINAHSTEVSSCTFEEQRRVLDIAQDEIGGPPADRQRRLGPTQPGGRAHRPHGGRGWRLGAAGVPAGAVHARPVAADGGSRISSAFADATDLPLIVFEYPIVTGQAIRATRCSKLCEEVPTIRAIKDWIGNVAITNGISAPCKACRAGERAHHAQRLAVLVLGARLQWPAVRLRQRDRRFAGAIVPRGAGQRSGASQTPQRPDSRRPRRCSTPIPSSTCTTA